jgi:hypothetical protein
MLFACQNETTESDSTTTTAIANRGCAAEKVLAEQLAADPTLAIRMNEIEEFTEKAKFSSSKLVDGKVVIPVVVNVLYNTTAENISDEQIQSQIDVLNEDFNALNSDFSSIPSEFTGVAASVGITFELSSTIRKSTTKTSWGTNDAMKKTSRGGISPTSPTTMLNIWVCTIGSGILGYAQFPGGSSSTDGVVCDSRYFGVTSDSGSAYPYNLGRTASHEIGHWMNLRHIWGDSYCGSDYVDDTPVHYEANYGVPTYPSVSACGNDHNEMTMNYMDYTDDRGMYMFTTGQKSRMSALFVSGGSRSGFLN